MEITKKFIEICENNDWTVTKAEDVIIFSKHSPEGEDFYMSIETNDLKTESEIIKEIENYALDFDIDDHVEVYIGMRGKYGVPKSISALVEDAKAIKEMIEELAEELKEGEKSEKN